MSSLIDSALEHEEEERNQKASTTKDTKQIITSELGRLCKCMPRRIFESTANLPALSKFALKNKGEVVAYLDFKLKEYRACCSIVVSENSKRWRPQFSFLLTFSKPIDELLDYTIFAYGKDIDIWEAKEIIVSMQCLNAGATNDFQVSKNMKDEIEEFADKMLLPYTAQNEFRAFHTGDGITQEFFKGTEENLKNTVIQINDQKYSYNRYCNTDRGVSFEFNLINKENK